MDSKYVNGVGYPDHPPLQSEYGSVITKTLETVGVTTQTSVVLIIPDDTRSVDQRALQLVIAETSARAKKLTVLIATGTHKAMDDAKIAKFIGVSEEELADLVSWLETLRQ